MNTVWLYALISVALVSLISLIGLSLLSLAVDKLRRLLFLLVSLSAGVLMGDAFIHLLPELVADYGFDLSVSLSVLSGITVFFIVEKIVHWRHCHHQANGVHAHPFVVTNLVGDTVHNMVDGLVIGASYLVSVPVGVATTIAVALHEIPQEVSDFGVLIHGGFSKQKALWVNFLVALSSIVGVVAALLLGQYVGDITGFLLAFSAGAFIYIAAADLIPELHKEVRVSRSLGQLSLFILGIFVMMALLWLK
ncbi:MAG: hypothetical protein A3D65_06215 [Candidatus Lloydbacteria bacterium RIFCSPHIGHO2_02_FULL_50_13]|uniref:ZIP family metal transporter n=1 Tax=Candidatus Lloydbacteria bacterium RIFCSPHIGHO2_02_FULL_50_13 TaxID=1798661 RepID=A0A1G2D719_9BACT|nr:MAG: hypothetical protein A3D65_06215 [Candidatus Lloydbacteria bacterium RIFCSPHIGHO2_02_FULL_50_13]